jgi:predicted kinase
MPTLTITRGVPASGKTTWAEAWVAEDRLHRGRVNRDDLRLMMWGVPHGLTRGQEEIVTIAQRAAVHALLQRDVDVVADDTNVSVDAVASWRRWAERVGTSFEVVTFDVPLEIALTRNAGRERPVPADVIARMHAELRASTP